MNVVMEDKIYNILDDYIVNIKPIVIYKGEEMPISFSLPFIWMRKLSKLFSSGER